MDEWSIASCRVNPGQEDAGNKNDSKCSVKLLIISRFDNVLSAHAEKEYWNTDNSRNNVTRTRETRLMWNAKHEMKRGKTFILNKLVLWIGEGITFNQILRKCWQRQTPSHVLIDYLLSILICFSRWKSTWNMRYKIANVEYVSIFANCVQQFSNITNVNILHFLL